MKRLKIISIAAVMLCSLVLIVPHSSHAASITSLSVNSSPDYGVGGYTSARLSTDEDILYIDWYVKQTYPADEADTNWTHVHTSMHPTGTRSVSVGIGSLEGHIKIAEYDIKAKVKFSDTSETSTTTTSVYKPVFDSSGYQKTGVYGYSELTAHYFNGTAIVMDGFVWAYNGTGKIASGFGRFRHTAEGKAPLEKDLPFENIKHGELYGYDTSHWGTYFNFHTGGDIEEGVPWVCEAYLRLKVSNRNGTDDWFAGDTNTFDHKDNR